MTEPTLEQRIDSFGEIIQTPLFKYALDDLSKTGIFAVVARLYKNQKYVFEAREYCSQASQMHAYSRGNWYDFHWKMWVQMIEVATSLRKDGSPSQEYNHNYDFARQTLGRIRHSLGVFDQPHKSEVAAMLAYDRALYDVLNASAKLHNLLSIMAKQDIDPPDSRRESYQACNTRLNLFIKSIFEEISQYMKGIYTIPELH